MKYKEVKYKTAVGDWGGWELSHQNCFGERYFLQNYKIYYFQHKTNVYIWTKTTEKSSSIKERMFLCFKLQQNFSIYHNLSWTNFTA